MWEVRGQVIRRFKLQRADQEFTSEAERIAKVRAVSFSGQVHANFAMLLPYIKNVMLNGACLCFDTSTNINSRCIVTHSKCFFLAGGKMAFVFRMKWTCKACAACAAGQQSTSCELSIVQMWQQLHEASRVSCLKLCALWLAGQWLHINHPIISWAQQRGCATQPPNPITLGGVCWGSSDWITQGWVTAVLTCSFDLVMMLIFSIWPCVRVHSSVSPSDEAVHRLSWTQH